MKGDPIIEVSPDCWDCMSCTSSIESAPIVDGTVTCPRCGAVMKIVRPPHSYTVTRMSVKLVRAGVWS